MHVEVRQAGRRESNRPVAQTPAGSARVSHRGTSVRVRQSEAAAGPHLHDAAHVLVLGHVAHGRDVGVRVAVHLWAGGVVRGRETALT